MVIDNTASRKIVYYWYNVAKHMKGTTMDATDIMSANEILQEDKWTRELISLLSEYAELNNEISQLEANLKSIKDRIAKKVAETDSKKVAIAGLGTAQITGDTQVVSYDTKKIDDLYVKLLENGENKLANLIKSAMKTSQRSGSLRITLEK